MSGPVSRAVQKEVDALPDDQLAQRVAATRSGASTPSTYAEGKYAEDELERRRLIAQRDARQVVDGRMQAARQAGVLPDPSEAMVIVSFLSEAAVRAVYRGPDPLSTFDVAWDRGRGWSCLCPAWRTEGECPHVTGLKYLTDGLIAATGRDGEEGSG